jgi:hypothetical protein
MWVLNEDLHVTRANDSLHDSKGYVPVRVWSEEWTISIFIDLA